MKETAQNDLDVPVVYYSYEDLDHKCRLLAMSIQQTRKYIDCILAVNGDGLFVGHLLAQYLHLSEEVWTMGIDKNSEARSLLYVPNPLFFAERNVLVVDLVSRTGKTLEQATRFLRNISVTRAVLFWLSQCSIVDTPPDYYAEDCREDITFIFPWTQRKGITI